MDKGFSSGASSTSPDPVTLSSSSDPTENRELLRVLLVGSRDVVTTTIDNLYNLGFAEVREWSELLPAPNPGEVISILSCYIVVE